MTMCLELSSSFGSEAFFAMSGLETREPTSMLVRRFFSAEESSEAWPRLLRYRWSSRLELSTPFFLPELRRISGRRLFSLGSGLACLVGAGFAAGAALTGVAASFLEKSSFLIFGVFEAVGRLISPLDALSVVVSVGVGAWDL